MLLGSYWYLQALSHQALPLRRHPTMQKERPDIITHKVSGTSVAPYAQEALIGFLSLIDPPKVLQIQNLPQLLFNIVDEATRIIGAERGTIYLVDYKRGILTSYIGHGLTIREITLPVGSGIAGHVVKTGETSNYADAYQCPFFDQSFDAQTGFRTRTVLSAPIKNQGGLIIGVIQLINKTPHFTLDDERFIKAYASYIAVSIENTQLYQEREKTFKNSIETIADVIDKRDPATAGHSSRVSRLSLLIAQDLKLSDTEQAVIEYAGLLHDIGKIGIRDAVLFKAGKLDNDEYASIKQHAVYTGDILRKMHWPEEWKDIPLVAALHHERLDGSGYPYEYRTENIPLTARILALVDTYDALIAIDRPYRRASPHTKVIEYLRQETEKGLYDKKVCITLKSIDLKRLQPIYGDRVYYM